MVISTMAKYLNNLLLISTLISLCNSTVYKSGEEVIPAAIQTRYSVNIRQVDLPKYHFEPQVVEVEGRKSSFVIQFKSASSNINVIQSHQSAEVPPVQESSSQDEPHYLKHMVTKPVIQEVREVISPYRSVIQEIRPVVEVIRTIISRGDQNRRETLFDSQVENFLVESLIDQRLYDGNSIYDLKYSSPNIGFYDHIKSSNNTIYSFLYDMLQIYRDKK